MRCKYGRDWHRDHMRSMLVMVSEIKPIFCGKTGGKSAITITTTSPSRSFIILLLPVVVGASISLVTAATILTI